MKKFKITKEQLRALKDPIVKEWFPKAFKEKRTPEEIIQEAIKRGFKKGSIVKRSEIMLSLFEVMLFPKHVEILNDNFKYFSSDDSLTLDGIIIYVQGHWAKILI